jgi:integral membrane protein (TIGR01906 family)
MRTSKLLTALLAAAAALGLLTAAIAVPILCRPFYYAHIGPLKLDEQTGLTTDQIKTAYGEMLDYCLGLRDDFSTGVLRWSESGKAHFTDVRGLFLLDLQALALAVTALVVLLLAAGVTGRRPARLGGHGPTFWAGAGLGAAFLLVGGWAALDFDRAFVVFHTLFFPGKDNWLFDPNTDQIINILPQQFFMDCAILILALLLAGCVGFLALDRRFRADQ